MDDDKETEYNIVRKKQKRKDRQYKSSISNTKTANFDKIQNKIIKKLQSKYNING
jgi:hypothetical protein